jgi:mRNA interferase MazF
MVTAAFQGDLGKPRPAVIIQADNYIEHHITLLLCPLSTFLSDASDFRPTIEPSETNGLKERSQAMADKMTHLKKTAIRQVIGHLNEDEMTMLELAIINITGLQQFRPQL